MCKWKWKVHNYILVLMVLPSCAVLLNPNTKMRNACLCLEKSTYSSLSKTLHRVFFFFFAFSAPCATVVSVIFLGGGGDFQPTAHFAMCVSCLTWGTCSISRRKICWLRETEFKRWYSTKSLRELNFTTHRKYFPAPSRRTLKCWTSFPNLEKVTEGTISDNFWQKYLDALKAVQITHTNHHLSNRDVWQPCKY